MPRSVARSSASRRRRGSPFVPTKRSSIAASRAARMRPERLVVGSMGGPLVAAVLEAIGEGSEGVLAAVNAPSLRQALSRLSGQLLMARPGLASDAARELLGEAFDIAVEIHML